MKIPAIAFIAGSIAVAAAQAGTLTLPQQKVGLWQQTYTTGGNAISDQVCLDPAAEAKIAALNAAKASKSCKSRTVTHNGDGSWHVDSICSAGPGGTVTSHTVVTGDFSSNIRAVVNTTVAGAPLATLNGTHQTILVASRLGPCKPGQKGGDLVMSNGVKINILAPH